MPLHQHRAAIRFLSTSNSSSKSRKASRLLHLQLPSLTPYPTASAVQETIIQRHFAWKDHLARSRQDASPSHIPLTHAPPPIVLTFSTPPTYTVGRRYLTTNPLPHSQISFLQGLSAENPTQPPLAEFYPSPRGGDLTYHAPGQLTAYAIIDLRTHNITPHNYVRLLENTVMKTCARLSVPNTITTDDPGVWIAEPASPGQATDRKICALGVQIRRGITGHGIGLNVHDHFTPPLYSNPDSDTQTGYLSWGFRRIVACGLEGKSVTWLTREGAEAHGDLNVKSVGRVFAEEFAGALDLGEDGEGNEKSRKAVQEITMNDIKGWSYME